MSEQLNLLDAVLTRQTSEIFRPGRKKPEVDLGRVALIGNWKEGESIPDREVIDEEAVSKLEEWFGLGGQVVGYVSSVGEGLPDAPVIEVGRDLITYDISYNNGFKNGFSLTTVEYDRKDQPHYRVFHRPFNDDASLLTAYQDFEFEAGHRYTAEPKNTD